MYIDETIAGISGGLSGIISTLVWYPLENIRIKLQQQNMKLKKEQEKESKFNDNLSEEENSLLRKEIRYSQLNESLINQTYIHLRKIFNDEGIKGLYYGISSCLIGIIQSNTIYFCSYQFFKNYFQRNNLNKNIILDSILTSFLAACLTSIVTNPIWVLNTRIIQSQKENLPVSNLEMTMKILKNEGVFAFFNGLIPSIIMTINPVIQYCIYEYLKSKFQLPNGDISSFNIIWISLISKYVTTIITYPMLSIKTLFQSNDGKPVGEIYKILKNILEIKGIKGLYDGISAKILQTLLNNVILMLSFEKLQMYLRYLLLIYINYKMKKMIDKK